MAFKPECPTCGKGQLGGISGTTPQQRATYSCGHIVEYTLSEPLRQHATEFGRQPIREHYDLPYYQINSHHPGGIVRAGITLPTFAFDGIQYSQSPSPGTVRTSTTLGPGEYLTAAQRQLPLFAAATGAHLPVPVGDIGQRHGGLQVGITHHVGEQEIQRFIDLASEGDELEPSELLALLLWYQAPENTSDEAKFLHCWAALEMLMPAPSTFFSDNDEIVLCDALAKLPPEHLERWRMKMKLARSDEVVNRLAERLAEMEYPSRRSRAREFLKDIGAADTDLYDDIVATRNALQHPGTESYPPEGTVWSQYQTLYKWVRLALARRLSLPAPY